MDQLCDFLEETIRRGGLMQVGIENECEYGKVTDLPSEEDMNVTLICIALMYVLYFFLTLTMVYNSYKYLYGQERYRFFHILMFYLISYAVILFRLSWFILIWLDIVYKRS